jgi:hypothetical protein
MIWPGSESTGEEDDHRGHEEKQEKKQGQLKEETCTIGSYRHTFCQATCIMKYKRKTRFTRTYSKKKKNINIRQVLIT